MIELINEAFCWKMKWGTHLNIVLDNCLHHIKQEAIIVKTLRQVLQSFSFCSLDTELIDTAGSWFINYQYHASR